jgi:3,4-dihydroxy 2-butanone 4-phosphate synthase / GTP cyclohydrolase II
MQLTPLGEAIERFRQGGFVALLDRPEREGEADLLAAAEHITGEKINFMATHARGLVTLAIAAARLRELDIRRLEPRFHGANVPAFTEMVDHTASCTTGVSAHERAATIRALLDPTARPEDFMRPGHVMPIAAAEGGLREREGHTEGAMALARLAGLYPAVVMCEVMAPDGHMARGADLQAFVRAHDVALVSVAQIVEALAAD